jgi:ATP-dependent Lon protease
MPILLKSEKILKPINRLHPYLGEGRVTSAIQIFDKDLRRIVTNSGRIYTLMGEPGYHPDCEYVWKRWKSLNNGQDECDVTDHYV